MVNRPKSQFNPITFRVDVIETTVDKGRRFVCFGSYTAEPRECGGRRAEKKSAALRHNSERNLCPSHPVFFVFV